MGTRKAWWMTQGDWAPSGDPLLQCTQCMLMIMNASTVLATAVLCVAFLSDVHDGCLATARLCHRAAPWQETWRNLKESSRRLHLHERFR